MFFENNPTNSIIGKSMAKLKPYQFKIEIIFGLALIAGISLSEINPAIGSPLLMISAALLSILYFLMAFVVNEGYNGIVVFLHKLTYISFAVCLTGILFALRHFPGSRNMLIIGISSIPFGLLGMIIFKLIKKEENKMLKWDILRAVIILSIVVATYFFVIDPNNPNNMPRQNNQEIREDN
ncbi:MAG: hypothetical protein ABIJ97_04105 [Bacteroidota bacterium]